MRTLLWSLLAALLIGTTGGAAQADRGPVDRTTLPGETSFRPGAGLVRIVGTTLTLAAGESRHLRGRLEATSDTKDVVAMNATVRCLAGPVQVGVSASSSRNHEGYDTTYYALDGHLPLYADLLFTAPAAGTYECGLYGVTASTSNPDYTLTAVPGRTWLEASRTDQAGAHWWQNPVCDSIGSSPTCSYIGPGQPGHAFVFYEPGLPHDQWTPGPGTTAVQASANVTLTTCYRLTASCSPSRVPEADRLPRGPESRSVVRLRLEALQMNAAGSHTCHTNATAPSTAQIMDDAHHYTAYLALPDIPVRPDCGRVFMLRVFVEHVSGSPVKIDGLQSTSLTNGMMLNL
ncbi:hypothetical protein [Jidongwangia harbinensis]|uniref:hypothetical protein n=1 Tax=Jidongwangia harbinensis TaxID=2878561 RepID=UPI001CD99EE0|nr:hypothetical protein [Jidongwangia harbinensis]MCA2213283.1 hypothetical protein [Jidongwangia harbinensis]